MKKYFDYVREHIFNGTLSIAQVKGQEYIIEACKQSKITDRRWVAYMLATAFHETAATMLPIAEYGKGKHYDYGKKLKMGKGPKKRVPYNDYDWLYYGRVYVQLTWYENYQKMGKLLKVDLLGNPNLAMQPDIAAKIMIEGMTRGKSLVGDFTGKCLENYFNVTTTDWVNARRIINGLDKAELIAKYAKHFYKALTLLSDGDN
jgi:hypothetical protein